MELAPFLETYTPGKTTPASPETIAAYRDILPESLIELWRTHGFGKYKDGLLEIIDPADFRGTLATWLGREVPAYVPIAISGFGDLFYYRKLTDTDEDICILDPHYR